MKVLVIEDNETVAQFVRKSLQEAGHCVEIASDSESGTAMIASKAFDAIILDRLLPAYYAADHPLAAPQLAPGKPVEITLVRWPYT